MTTLVVVELETGNGSLDLVSTEALTFARSLPGGALAAVVIAATTEPGAALLAHLRDQGVAPVYVCTDSRLEGYAARAWAQVVLAAARATGARTLFAGGTPRGTEVLAHVAALREVAMAANIVAVTSADPLEVERQVAGGAVLERVALGGDLAVATMAGHAVAPEPAAAPGRAQVESLTVDLTDADLLAQITAVIEREGGDASALTGEPVVVGAGRGVGGPDQFDVVEQVAARLGGAVGVSRGVTSLGWRPQHEQVGQTGSRIAPDLYLACGISGAIQHWAGCSSAKVIIAVNTDAAAPMVTKARYAVIGDMHEVLPALLAELDGG